jgi:Asp-tRNA(Asn)/Glu-tRNA(Gln) amidotransferase C subunit
MNEDLSAIVEFVGKVKEFGGKDYDDFAEGNHVTFDDLREDKEIRRATPEQLLANTDSENNCYVIPRVIDS